jgi:predicted methyltransferase
MCFQPSVACRVSVTYTGALFDNGGDRIAHVDVDHRRIDFLLKEVIKKSVEIDDVSAITKNRRQPMQLVILDKNNDKVLSSLLARLESNPPTT